ncbi:ATP-dependent helicase HrpB [Thiomicrorhabdus immobilis]|uniref:ATP-dependent helicase HrpB n=1 Tax=Thiomicrorhabdus immobilis TaxID=2791037 RepID=A0ABM7MCH6_9GAMM|nr:ATP-dependent helicase HrpB [Thiomicrorhabdus immobilis]BCN93080.1 ATP-dependent helicase HrpB [Thiomicrorhabdus immobilis]
MTQAPGLPVQGLLPKIEQTVANNLNTILKAEPGAGKSTLVPLHLLKSHCLNGQKIVLLEPRRLAARSLADFLAKQLNEPVGKTVGYQVRNDKKISSDTRLEVITEGILIRRLQQDPELNGTGLVIFDEFHERSLEADLALALCLDSQTALREDLKLLVMSATLETATLSKFLNDAPVIECPGRSFPVEYHYSSPNTSTNNQTWQTIKTDLVKTLQVAMRNHPGDCLVFLPGKAEISQATQLFEESSPQHPYRLIPLHGGLSPQQQNHALQADKEGKRKIIFATNIAETSLTIEGIHIVVDSGLVRQASYDASSGMTRMLTQKISKASAKQRAGRAGRLQPGHAYRLWSESEQASRTEFEQESILNSDLTDLCLETAMWGVTEPLNMQWLTPPPITHLKIAQQLLQTLGFLNPKNAITALGEQAMQLGVSARLAKLLLYPQPDIAMQEKLCDIAAILGEHDLLTQSYSANLQDRIQVFQSYKTHPKNNQPGLVKTAAKEALSNSRNWRQRLVKLNSTNTDKPTFAPISPAQAIALAYPDRIAKRRGQQDNRYLMSNGKGTFLPEQDTLIQHEYLVVTNLDGQRRDGKIFMAIPISLAEIESLFAKQITEHTEVEFNLKKHKVEGIQTQKLGAITLKKQQTDKLSKQQVQTCIIEHLKQTKLADLPLSKTSLEWLKRVNWLAQYHNDYLGFGNDELVADFDTWCAPYLTNLSQWSDLHKIDLHSLLQARLSYEATQNLSIEAPSHYQAPSGKRVAIDYQIGKQPTLSIQLQELFGELSSPKIGFGQATLSFELLSPARRPIQITSDLGNFWQNSYLEIAKEMRGKYPKHRWPENPLEEKAGRSLQINRQRK